MAKIDTYLYRVNSEDVACLTQHLTRVLSSQELSRYHAYRVVQPQEIYLCGRYLIKTVLAQHLGCTYQEIELALQEQGKPKLSAPSEMVCEFNLSHSGAWLLLAVSRHMPVGVDLELCKQHDDLNSLAERVMTYREWRRFRKLPKSQWVDHFHRVWVIKEAYTKLLGQGIWQTLQQVETQLTPPAVSHDQPPAQIRYLGVPPPLRAALAHPLCSARDEPLLVQHYLADLGVTHDGFSEKLMRKA